MTRILSELNSASPSVRMQAFTFMLWVRHPTLRWNYFPSLKTFVFGVPGSDYWHFNGKIWVDKCLQVAKALLLRYHPTCAALTDEVKIIWAESGYFDLQCISSRLYFLMSPKLFSLLDDADLGPAAADGFSLLMSDSANVLSRACHADVRIMYRQRFFSENSAKLVQGFNAAPQGGPVVTLLIFLLCIFMFY